MTKQQIFNRVSWHLLRQNCRCEDSNGCLYRGPGGTKCALGCLIPNSFYKKDMEGMVAQGVFRAFPDLAKKLGINPEKEDFIYDLQIIHDQNPPSEWRNLLVELAEKHGLKIPKILKS